MYHMFLSQLPVDGYLGCFLVLAIMNSAATNIGVRVSFQIRGLFFPDVYPEVELLDHMVALFFVLKESPYCFPQWRHRFLFSTVV